MLIIHFYDADKKHVRSVEGDSAKVSELGLNMKDLLRILPGEMYFSICCIRGDCPRKWLECQYCREMGYYSQMGLESDSSDDEECC